jgi:hypothetical protein
MKDEETTLNCTQVFVVTACQPRALEVVIAGQSYLLCPGDHFFVPQGTHYHLVNYSPTTAAEVAFIVIKPSDADAVPVPPPEGGGGGGGGGGGDAGSGGSGGTGGSAAGDGMGAGPGAGGAGRR